MTDGTLSKQEARAIIRGLDPGAIARRVWRAATGGGAGNNAAALLDLGDGAVRIVAWRGGGTPHIPHGCVVLAWTTDLTRERVQRSLTGASCLPPSAEVVEEEVARRAAGEGLCWPSIEEQLRRA